jgi:putative flavoprotein involved in K+ transport
MNGSRFPVVIVGGGQAGLSASAWLKKEGTRHVIFEKNRVAHAWRSQRWDAFCLVTPNWQCQLPDFPYPGNDPNGFMPREDIVAYVEAFAREIDAPVREGINVSRIGRDGKLFVVETSEGTVIADNVILAVSGYHVPNVPRVAERLADGITQIHSANYKNPAGLPPGEVMVVGSAQSGCQIAEDLHLAGRKVHLVVGSAPRCARLYRGRDTLDWLYDLGQYDMPVDQHTLGDKVRKNANHYFTGRDGGRDIDLRRFALEGMKLYGRLTGAGAGKVQFADDLKKNLDAADQVYNGICGLIDRHIEEQRVDAPKGRHYSPVWQPEAQVRELDLVSQGITSIVWATGFRSDWSFVDLPLFNGSAYPVHKRGVTSIDGVYVIGLPWLWTWGSGRFLGVGRDAQFVVNHLAHRMARGSSVDAQCRSRHHSLIDAEIC